MGPFWFLCWHDLKQKYQNAGEYKLTKCTSPTYMWYHGQGEGVLILAGIGWVTDKIIISDRFSTYLSVHVFYSMLLNLLRPIQFPVRTGMDNILKFQKGNK